MNAIDYRQMLSALYRQPVSRKRRRTLSVMLPLLLSMALTLAGCGRSEPPPAETAPSGDVPASPTDVTVEEPAADADAPNTQMPVITLEAAEPFSAMDTPAPNAAALPTDDDDGAFAPLEVTESGDCPVESDLDLAGYPAVETDMGCATSEAVFDSIGFNEFGDGPDFDRFMLWFSMENTIYVLLPNGDWETYPDTWDESQPEFSCNPYGGEPQSPPLPRRGFNKVWCEHAEIQMVMGPVPREERLCQHAVLQPFEQGRVLACFEDATVRYFQIRDNGSWTLDVQ